MNFDKKSYEAGQAQGKTEEKGNQLADKAASAAQTAKESVMSAGATVQATAVGAVDAVKNATGMKK